ncbi:MAG TPA: putative aminohydrolase SsnA [Spirochaetia bacterium]|nr:putative aminohydrolase SsnA [Spirochaetia bacterium]
MLALKNATVLHLSPADVTAGVDVLIEGTEIAAVGMGAAEGVRAERSIDLDGRLLMPGLVCSHDHFYSGLSRGIIARIAPSSDFVSTLANLWWRLDRAIDPEILRASATICALEAVKAGCTAVIDHHASPSCIEGSLGTLKECFEKVGLRGILCYETTDRNGAAGMEQGVRENRGFARSAEEERKTRGKQRLVEAMIGGHAPFTLGDDALAKLGEAVRETGRGFHIHVAEDGFDPSYSHRFHGKDPLKRLDGFGLVTEKSIVAHGLYLTQEDREILNARDAFLAHNCRSNMNNAVGYNRELPHVKNVALGTDGIGSDMLQEVKFAYFRHRDSGGPLAPGAFMRFLQNGNEILRRSFGESFGRVERGYAADLIILDYDSPTPLVRENVAGHAVFGMGSRDVHTVIVNGKIVMEARSFRWDAAAAYAGAREAAQRLWRKMDALG